MSVGPLGGLAGSAAGSPLAQTQGSDIEKAQQDVNAQQRQIQTEKKAESAAGIIVHPHLSVAMEGVDRAPCAIDWNQVVIYAKAVALRVTVREEPSL